VIIGKRRDVVIHRAESFLISLRSQLGHALYLLLILVVAYVGWFKGEEASPFGPDTSLLLDVKIPAGNRIEAYCNGLGQPIVTQRTTADRVVVGLHGLPHYISTVRLDLSEIAGIAIEIFSVSLERKGEKLASFSPDQLKGMFSLQGAVLESQQAPGGDSLTIRTVTTDPIITFSPAIASVNAPPIIQRIPLISGSLSLTLACVCIFILVALGARSAQVAALSVVISLGLAWLGLHVLASADLPQRYLPIDLSVGQASYSGYPKGTEFLLYQWSLLMVVAVGLLTALVVRLWRDYRRLGSLIGALRCFVLSPASLEGSVVATAKRTNVQRVTDVAMLSLFPLYYFLVMFPDLRANLGALQQPLAGGTGLGGFDGSNVFTWCALRVFGFMAHRDYWFPYAGFHNALYDTPMDLLRNHLHTTAVWGVVLCGVYRVTQFSKLSVLAAALFLSLMSFNGLLGGHSRYLMSLGLVLCASVAFLMTARPTVWVLFGAYLGYVLGQEPHQVIYSSLAIALILISGYSSWRTAPLTMLLCVGAGAAVAIAVWLVPLVRQQQLDGFLAFFIRAGGMLSSVAVPSEIVRWMSAPIDVDSVLLLGGLALLLIGVHVRVAGFVRRERSPLVITALALGLLFLVVFTKQLVRPHIATQLVGIPLFGGLLLALEWAKTWTARQRVWCAVCLGCFFAHLDLSGFGVTKLWDYSKRIASVKPYISLAMDPEIRTQRTEEQLYSLSRFTSASPFLVELAAILERDEPSEGSRPLVYVLGDESYVYPVLRQLPPRFVSFYDGSDIRAQTETVSWLGLYEPKYVLMNPAATSFDGVPNVVRVPKVFGYVVKHYRFHRSLGGMHLLIRRDDTSVGKVRSEDLQYWSTTLGVELDLGALPSLSTIRYREVCTEGSVALCEPVIRVNLKQRANGRQPRTIELKRGGESFRISFLTHAGMRSYSIKASSVWFLVNTPIQEWKLSCAVGSASCEAVRVEYRRFRVPQLY
jgi:hypothetical protein